MPRFHWPWAKREHCHGDPTLFKYATCPACGHEVLTRHASAKRVRVKVRGVEWGYVFGAGCDPGWDLIEVLKDGQPHAFAGDTEVELEPLPESIRIEIEDWVQRLRERDVRVSQMDRSTTEKE